MGVACCKSTTDDGLVYNDEDFKNYYSMDAPIIQKGENENDKQINMMVKSAAVSVSNTLTEDTTFSSEMLDKSKSLLRNLSSMNNPKTKVNFSVEDQKLAQTSKNDQPIKPGNIIETLNTNISIPKVLKIVIKESKYNRVGDELIINSRGLIGSKRLLQNQDGHVYFGHQSDDIDYYLNPEEGIQPKHFEIKYDQITNEYLVNNIKGSGVFIKIDTPFELKDGIIISFGTNHIVVSISFKNEEQMHSHTSIIKFKAIYGPNKGKD